MVRDTVFSFVKRHVLISDFVRTLPACQGLSAQGDRRWRCNNVISGGSNPTAMLVDDESGFFVAFSHDQQRGDVISLYQHTLGTGLGAYEAAIALAHHMGVDLPEELLSSRTTTSRTSIIDVLSTCATRAHRLLVDHPTTLSRRAYEYALSRGLTDELIEQWQIGYVPPPGEEHRFMLSCGPRDILQAAGLLSGKSGDFVSLAGRLVFPIFRAPGECIAFSARSCSPDMPVALPKAKYVNTPTTAVFDKSSVMYGMHRISSQTRHIVVCEGNLDVIALNAAMPPEWTAVAMLGSALTHDHIPLLSRPTIESTTVMYDSDPPGRKALQRAVWLANHVDRSYAAFPPAGKDAWDSWCSGADLMKPLLSRTTLVDMCARIIARDNNKNTYGQALSEALSQLSFSGDKNLLVSSAMGYLGLSRSAVLGLCDVRPHSRSHAPARTDDISAECSTVIELAGMLSPGWARTLLFPLFEHMSDNVCSRWFECAGIVDEYEQNACLLSLGLLGGVDPHDTLHEVVSRHTPVCGDEQKIEELCTELACTMALRLVRIWEKSALRDIDMSLIPTVQTIAERRSNLKGKELLSVISEVAVHSA